MARGPSPLLGYNTNVRHKGKLYHIQTEDSGVNRPHIITHLFADGGRIVASKKTSYTEHVGVDGYQAIVKKLMQDQHKAMFIALRDGVFDESEEQLAAKPETPSIDTEALERAAQQLQQGRAEPAGAGHYKSTQPAADSKAPSTPPESIFGSDLLSEKSLDEVILSYLADDLEEA